MSGTMQSFDIAAKKPNAASPRKCDDCLHAIFFPELDTRLGNWGLPSRAPFEDSGTHASMGVTMLCVKIVQQPNKAYPYAAVHQQTGGTVPAPRRASVDCALQSARHPRSTGLRGGARET